MSGGVGCRVHESGAGGSSSLRNRFGHTLVEVSIVLLLISVLTASAFAVLAGQRRFYAVQQQVAATRDVARVALGLLSAELRAASSEAGDLYAIDADSVALRSYAGFGAVCGSHGDEISVRRIAGTFAGSRSDSILVFLERRFVAGRDDAWGGASIVAAHEAGDGRCPDGGGPDLVLRLSEGFDGAAAGAPLRAFRPYVYRLYRGSDDRWWLGQRLRDGRFQPAAGPFADPAAGGLRLEFLDGGGQPTADARAVARVRISVLAESLRPVPGKRGPAFVRDSLSTVVLLRNSCGGRAWSGTCPAPGGPGE